MVPTGVCFPKTSCESFTGLWWTWKGLEDPWLVQTLVMYL